MTKQLEFYQAKLEFEIDSWDLHEMLKQNKDVIIIDTRSAEAYLNENIPAAINLPHKTMNIETTSTFNKDTLYVTYCDGIGCNASTRGALNLTKLGFKVKELLGGIDWWKRDGYETKGENGKSENKIKCGC